MFGELPEGFRNGRNLRDGYARGWGLEFGDLAAKVAADPLYQAAMELARGRTIQSERNRMNIFLVLKLFAPQLPAGDIVEFGSYKGGSAIFMAKVCQALLPGTRVFAFDTFAGMPKTDRTVDYHVEGDFGDVDFEELSRFVSSSGLSNLELVRGSFEETVPGTFQRMDGIRLAHVDCDIRAAVEFSYESAKPKMVPGGYMIFDDALYSSCIGATEAVEDLVIARDRLNSEQVYPHFVFRIWPDATIPSDVAN